MAFIYRHTASNETVAITLRPGGAKVYPKGLGLGPGIFIAGHYTANDLEKIFEAYLALCEEVDRAFEEWDGEI